MDPPTVTAVVYTQKVKVTEAMHATILKGEGLDIEMDSDATVPLSEDELSMNTGSPRPSPTVGSLLAEGVVQL